jgi:hypothetical protein
LSDGAAHVDQDKIAHIQAVIAASYGMDRDKIDVVITGSAKTGFTTISKTLSNGTKRPKYSAFDISSDIDVAIISPKLFDTIWHEFSRFSSGKPFYPWRSGRLGDYLVCGWLRPDHFPQSAYLYNANEWWPTFERLSRSSKFGRRRVNGGLFHSAEHLKIRLKKVVQESRLEEFQL